MDQPLSNLIEVSTSVLAARIATTLNRFCSEKPLKMVELQLVTENESFEIFSVQKLSSIETILLDKISVDYVIESTEN